MKKTLLQKRLAQCQGVVDRALTKYLPPLKAKPARIHKAMDYSVKAGGKRLRPLLVMEAARLCGLNPLKTLPTACAMEMIHTYSLVHDDLPAMDNDDLRRGRPTNHVVYGEDIAILAGDALLTRAFEVIANNSRLGVKPERVVEALRVIAAGAGTFGMIGGQVADISADKGRWQKKSKEFKNASEWLTFIHLNKTAALIRASLLAGAALAGAPAGKKRALDQYGRAIGLAFQIQDDILDVVGDKKKLGKRGSDAKNKKLTYSTLFGLDASRRKAEVLLKQAHAVLKPFGKSGQLLHELADFILARDH